VRVGIGAIPSHYDGYIEWLSTAEAVGFHTVSTGDSSGLWTDPYVTLAVAAAHTRTVQLMVVGTNPITRHPLASAGAIESIQVLSQGRCAYALGTGDSAVATIGHRRAGLGELEAYGRTVQGLCAGQTMEYRGQSLQLRWATHPVPVYLCAEGPKTQVLAGRFADGAILYNGITEDVVTASLSNIWAGAAEAGRSPDAVELWWPIVFHLTDDVTEGLEAIKFSLAGTANRAFRQSLSAKLVPEALHAGFRGLQREYKSTHHQQLGDHVWNASLVDKYGLADYLAARFAIVGPPALCVERLAEIRSYGVQNVTLSLLSRDIGGQIETMKRLADTVLPHLPSG
jgi:5,10-methylenetetrahydromethanopterin reductase